MPRPLVLPPAVKCEITGHTIYTVREKNLEVREEINRRCLADHGFRSEILRASMASWFFFCSYFVFTKHENEIAADGTQSSRTTRLVQPLVPFAAHLDLRDQFMYSLLHGLPLICKKSRDMVATWIFLTFAAHDLIFREHHSILMGSEKEDKVDGGDDSALLPRLWFILQRLPKYMRPRFRRKHMLIENMDSGFKVNGEATNPNWGVSGRRLWALLDEAGINEHLATNWRRVKATTSTPVALSATYGPNAFECLVAKDKAPKFFLMYWQHPEKGRDPEKRIDHSGKYTNRPGSEFIWTPWLEAKARTDDPLTLAMNEMGDASVGGSNVFRGDIIARQRTAVERPYYEGDLLWHDEPGTMRDHRLRTEDHTVVEFVNREGGRLLWWGELVDGRPPQDAAYVIGSDVSQGQGASNSIAAIGDVDTLRKVGMYIDSRSDPHTWSRILAGLGLWCGGRTGGKALVGWERDGAGCTLGGYLSDLKYGRVYIDDDGDAGWKSGKAEKVKLVLGLAAAWTTGKTQEPEEATLDEAGTFIWLPTGAIESQRLVQDKDAKATHGDRIIGTALMWKLLQLVPVMPPAELPPGQGFAKTRRQILQERSQRAKRRSLIQ